MDKDTDELDQLDDQSAEILSIDTPADDGWALGAGAPSFSPAGCCCEVQVGGGWHLIEGYDTNGDGIADAAALDTDGDGRADAYYIDEDRDGIWDTIRDLRGNVIGVPLRVNPPEPMQIAPPPSAVDPNARPSSPIPAGQPQAGDGTPRQPVSTPASGAQPSAGNRPTIIFIQPDGSRIAVPATDTDGDGIAESVGLDENGDGVIDTLLVDSDGDGIADTFYVDIDGDGEIEKFVEAAEESGRWRPAETDNTPQAAPSPGPQTVATTPSAAQGGPVTATKPYDGYIPDPQRTGDTVTDMVAKLDHDVAETAAQVWVQLFPELPLPSQNAGQIFTEALMRLPRDSDTYADVKKMLDSYQNMVAMWINKG